MEYTKPPVHNHRILPTVSRKFVVESCVPENVTTLHSQFMQHKRSVLEPYGLVAEACEGAFKMINLRNKQ